MPRFASMLVTTLLTTATLAPDVFTAAPGPAIVTAPASAAASRPAAAIRVAPRLPNAFICAGSRKDQRIWRHEVRRLDRGSPLSSTRAMPPEDWLRYLFSRLPSSPKPRTTDGDEDIASRRTPEAWSVP